MIFIASFTRGYIKSNIWLVQFKQTESNILLVQAIPSGQLSDNELERSTIL